MNRILSTTNKELEYQIDRLNIHIAELLDQGSIDIADILVDYRDALSELNTGGE